MKGKKQDGHKKKTKSYFYQLKTQKMTGNIFQHFLKIETLKCAIIGTEDSTSPSKDYGRTQMIKNLKNCSLTTVMIGN